MKLTEQQQKFITQLKELETTTVIYDMVNSKSHASILKKYLDKQSEMEA